MNAQSTSLCPVRHVAGLIFHECKLTHLRFALSMADHVFNIQTELITERSVSSSVLRSAGQWLQPQHYASVTEERSEMGVCGWPLCAATLSKDTNRPRYRYVPSPFPSLRAPLLYPFFLFLVACVVVDYPVTSQ